MALRTAFVTGAPGWLGTRLVTDLLSDGFEVRCLVLPGTDTAQLGSAHCSPGDVTSPQTVRGMAEGCDVVFHAAGLIHPTTFGLGELKRINAFGTRNVLAEAIRAGAKRFVQVSSNSACGTNISRDIPMTEYTQTRPYMAYGRSKLAGELAVNEAFAKGQIETTIVRPCWFYGPGQPERQTRLMRMIIEGKAPLFGQGTNRRSMTYVPSLSRALLSVASESLTAGETYWLCDEKPYTTIEIYGVLAQVLGVELRYSPLPAWGSPASRLADAMIQAVGLYQTEIHVAGEMDADIFASVTKAKKDFGYEAPTDLRDGMAVSAAWARERGLLPIT